MSRIPAWFQRTVADGIAVLTVLELPGQPYTDDDERRVREVWCQVLWRRSVDWREELDASRLQEAFMRLAGTVTRWPAPAQLIEYMPARPQPRALSAPQMSRQQRERNSRRLRAALRKALSQGGSQAGE